MKNEEYINRWLQGTLDENELRIFEKSEEYKSLEKLSKSLAAFKAPDFIVDEEFKRLKFNEPRGKVVTLNWLNPFLKIAAIVLVSVGIYFFFWHEALTELKTIAGEKKEVFLPDSSSVTLNALSSLSFDKKKWKNKRTVVLSGEAFFKVFKGAKFNVETPAGTVSVLGTEFNVTTRKDYFEVICFEGLVQVQTTQGITRIHPQQMFRILNGSVKKDSLAIAGLPGWMMDESTFKSVPYKYVIQEFERQYNVKITAQNIDTNQLFTGSFTHTDLSLAIKSISVPLNITYRVSDDKNIILFGEAE